MTEAEMQREQRARDLVDELSRFVSGMSAVYAEEFALAVQREHRTLQQSLFGAFMVTVAHWAKRHEEGNYDLRNEYACQVSKKIVDFLSEQGLPLRGPFL